MSLTLRAENRLEVFENGTLRETFGSKREEVTEEYRIMDSFMICTDHQISFGVIKFTMGWVGHVVHRAHRVLVGTLEGNDGV